jgi:hypothetical protein
MLLEVILLLALGRRDGVDHLLGPRSIAEETEEVLEAAGLAESMPSPLPQPSPRERGSASPPGRSQ